MLIASSLCLVRLIHISTTADVLIVVLIIYDDNDMWKFDIHLIQSCLVISSALRILSLSPLGTSAWKS